jgi:hypothetical protein
MPYTTRQLAAEAGVSMAWIRQLCTEGVLPSQKFGHVWLISDEAGEEWLRVREDGRGRSPESASGRP